MSSSSSTTYLSKLLSPPPETRNWLDLPHDVTATILLKLGVVDILNNAQRVCKQWRSICNDPLMWCTIDLGNAVDLHNVRLDLKMMCRHAIDRSHGNLVDISIEGFCTNNLLNYIADSASHLQRLRLVCCHGISDEGLSEVAKKLPCLEELDITLGQLSKNSLEAIGRCCPLLKSLKFNMQSYTDYEGDDGEAFAIAKTMPNLRHLQLFGNNLTDEGLLAILDGCPHLESLDLRDCFNVDLGGNLGRRCAEQIKDFLEPDDPDDDFPFDYDENHPSFYSWQSHDSFDTRYWYSPRGYYSDESYETVESDPDERNAWLLDWFWLFGMRFSSPLSGLIVIYGVSSFSLLVLSLVNVTCNCEGSQSSYINIPLGPSISRLFIEMLLCGLLYALYIPAGVELPERIVSAICGVIAMEYLVVDDESLFSFPTKLPKRLDECGFRPR
ncbi:hypothetical protein RIF29_42233 [Crotalaria pallida]|uniref:F-box domain-containing protein n=1 Tax=Crotalaria pallida TaxID=3830 RepID=A0AAN9HTG2_CROPI